MQQVLKSYQRLLIYFGRKTIFHKLIFFRVLNNSTKTYQLLIINQILWQLDLKVLAHQFTKLSRWMLKTEAASAF